MLASTILGYGLQAYLYELFMTSLQITYIYFAKLKIFML